MKNLRLSTRISIPGRIEALRQPPDRAEDNHIWLPGLIVKNDPTTVALSIDVQGYINEVWVHDFFNGPYTPDELVGLHLGNLLARLEEVKMISWINKAIHGNEIIRGSITLDMAVEHTRRLARIFKQDRNRALALIIKQE